MAVPLLWKWARNGYAPASELSCNNCNPASKSELSCNDCDPVLELVLHSAMIVILFYNWSKTDQANIGDDSLKCLFETSTVRLFNRPDSFINIKF
jgi:hypothetical protein